jgi:hypothetical protein
VTVAPQAKTVVILQPQFFPWRGVFEQIRLADAFIHLDDTQYQKGGFTNRVQIKTPDGSQWLTVPVLRSGSLPRIDATEIDYKTGWREKHLRTLRSVYARAPFVDSMCMLVDDIYGQHPRTIAELDMTALERVCAQLGLRPVFSRSSTTPVTTVQTQRLLDLLAPLGATAYVTGHGALGYLDEPLMAAQGVTVRVMEYERTPYPQLHGAFDPHVSILDLLANTGPEAAAQLTSGAVPWNQYRTEHGI